MAKRITKEILHNITLEQAQEASGKFAKASTSHDKISAKMNEELNKIKTKYEPELTQLEVDMEGPTKVLMTYATEQKDSWGKKKSLDLLHTTIGFRTSPPSVIKDSTKVTWNFIIDQLKKSKKMLAFIRTKTEVNKDAILALKDEKVLATLKKDYFIAIEQKETCFVEVKKEENKKDEAKAAA